MNVRLNDTSFTVPCSKLVNLKELDIYVGNEDAIIKNNTFSPLQRLRITKLRVEVGHLQGVEPLAFSWFPDLVLLDMSRSQELSLADMYPAWEGLIKTSVEILKFNFFNSVDKRATAILNETFFAGLALSPSLRELHLEGSRITEINWARFGFSKLANLEYFSLAHNLLSDYKLCMLSLSLTTNRKFRYLDVSYQQRCTVSQEHRSK